MFDEKTSKNLLAVAATLREKALELHPFLSLKIQQDLDPTFQTRLRTILEKNVPIIQSMMKRAKEIAEENEEEYTETEFFPDVNQIVESLTIPRHEYLLLEYGDVRFGVEPLQTFSRLKRSFL